MQFCSELLYLWRLPSWGLGAFASRWICLWFFCHPFLHFFDAVLDLDDVWVFCRVMCLQHCELVLQCIELLFQRFWILVLLMLRNLQVGLLLIEQGLIERLVLLRTAQRLCIRFEL